MPRTEVIRYMEDDGTIPLDDWFASFKGSSRAAEGKCKNRIVQLGDHGYELEHPYARTLDDGLYALRIKVRKIHYRIFYFFHGQNVVVLTHGCTKEKEIPPIEIKRALEMKMKFESDPEGHTA